MKKLFFVCLSVLYGAHLLGQVFSYTTAPGSPITAFNNQRGLTSADLNNDSIRDLVDGGPYSNQLHVLLGNGNGSFSPAPGTPSSVAGAPAYIVIHDFNSDGFRDLATANNGGGISILLGNGVGSFTQAAGSPINTSTITYCIAKADFNLDGNMDLVSVNTTPNLIYVHLGNGTGSFTLASGFPISAGGGPYHVSTGFFNNDNFADFAVANGNGNSLTVLLGNGTGSFSPAAGSPYNTGIQPRTVFVRDINNDGNNDLMVPTGADSRINIFLGSPTGSFVNGPGSPYSIGGMPYMCTVNDFDLDGSLDIAVTTGSANSIVFLKGIGTGSFYTVPSSTLSIGNYPQAIVSNDFNGDQKMDLAVSDWVGNKINVLINTATLSTAFINSYANDQRIRLYPNPAKDIVEVDLGTSIGNVSVNICNLDGNSVLSTMLTDESPYINTQNLSNGVYLVQLQQGAFVIRKSKITICR